MSMTSLRCDPIPAGLLSAPQPPKALYARGDLRLLERPFKVAVVGTRKPIRYAADQTIRLAREIVDAGGTVVSGAAMGIDACAHQGGIGRTIAVLGNGLDIAYPAVNRELIRRIGEEGLLLSEYPDGTAATRYSFVLRNRLVVALSDAVVIAQADPESGSLRSAAYARAMGKPLFVLPHRAGESGGTQDLLEKGYAMPLYRNEILFDALGSSRISYEAHPPVPEESLDEAYRRHGERLYDMELDGTATIKNGRVYYVFR